MTLYFPTRRFRISPATMNSNAKIIGPNGSQYTSHTLDVCSDIVTINEGVLPKSYDWAPEGFAHCGAYADPIRTLGLVVFKEFTQYDLRYNPKTQSLYTK